MPPRLSALDLLRAVGLSADGPVVWGSPARSRVPGVLVAELAEPLDRAPVDAAALRAWLELAPSLRLDGEEPTPTQLAERLGEYWLAGQSVLYVGRTQKQVGPRVAALYATPLGHRRPHAGGHWLKALRNFERLRIWWAESDAPEEYEDALLNAFAESIDRAAISERAAEGALLPFAVLETATGERRDHGITGSLIEPGEAMAQPRRSTARKTTARPRATTAGARSGGTGTRRAANITTGAPAPERTRLSAEGLARLEAELQELRVEQRPQVIARVAAARQLGDLRENADYEAARNEQSFLEGRIRSIEAMLVTAEVIKSDDTGQVQVGSTVALDHEGERVTYRIVGSAEADPVEGRISNVSPVGRALLGHRVGEDVAVPLPGREVRYRIVEVT